MKRAALFIVLFAGSIAFSSSVSGQTNTPIIPQGITDEAILSAFEDRLKVAAPSLSKIRKFGGPIRATFISATTGQINTGNEYLEVLTADAERWKRIAFVDISLVAPDEWPNFLVIVHEGDFEIISPRATETIQKLTREDLQQQGLRQGASYDLPCSGSYAYYDDERGTVSVSSRNSAYGHWGPHGKPTQDETKQFLLATLQSCTYSNLGVPSAAKDGPAALALKDIRLRLLYDPRIKSGMPIEMALPIFKQILSELRQGSNR